MSITNSYLDHSIADLITRTKGLDEIYDAVAAIVGGATAAQVWAYATRTLTDPDSYKADVSALALESGGNIATILTAIQHGTYGLSALDTDLGTLLTRLSAARAGYLDELDFDLNARLGSPAGASLAADLLTIDNLIDDLESRLTATRAGYLDNLSAGAVALASALTTHASALSTHDTDMKADFDRHLTHIDCWGDMSALVTITGASSDVNLPDVIIPTLPTGATIWKVVLIGLISMIRDTSTADNAINGAAAIRIKKSTGAWGTDDIVALDVPDDAYAVDVSTSPDRNGAPLMGNINNDELSSEVDAAATYNLRFEDIQADGANLELHDVIVGLRVWFY